MTRSLLSVVVCGLLAASNLAQSTAPAPLSGETVRVVGRVVLWDGQPVAGAAVGIGSPKATSTADLLRKPPTTTDAQGCFEVTTAPPRRDETEPRMLLVAAKGMAAVAHDIGWKRLGNGEEATRTNADSDGGSDGAAAVDDGQPVRFAPQTTVDDIVLTAGQRLFGRVRDRSGKALANARVVASDLLEQRQWSRGSRAHGYHCSAHTDGNGIFDLPCALPVGTHVEITAEGHYQEQIYPVAVGTPIEVALQPSGWIQGRVLDPDGHSIEGANVTVAYEARADQASVRTGADGSFRLDLQRPGRWRLLATKRLEHGSIQGHSPVLSGARENLEVLVKVDADEQAQRLPVRVVAKKSGTAVAAFKAVAVWEDYANQSSNYLEYRLRSQLHAAAASKDGNGEVGGPGKHGSAAGVVRIVAAGFAPATRRDVEWKDLAANETREPLQFELEVESSVAGIVRDETSGEPVAGARVYARPRTDPNQGVFDEGSEMPVDAPTTAADGSFRLGGLGEGTWEVVVRDRRRPRCPALEVALAGGEQKTGVVVTVPSGASVTGKLVGTPIGHGWRVFLSRLPKQFFGEGNFWFNYYGGQQADDTGVPIAADGSFRLEGVALDNHQLVVRLPSPPRLGGDLFLPIEPVRVRRAGVARDFDCSEDRPGSIRGKVTFAHAAVPFDQILVVARVVQEEGQQLLSPFETTCPGSRSFVSQAGDFEVRVGPGNYQLVVFDLALGIPLHQTEKRTEVRAGAVVERNLAPELAKVEIDLKPAANAAEMAFVERIEVRILTKAMKGAGMQVGDNDTYDTGTGVPWAPGQTKATVCLPLGEATLLARNNIGALRLDEERWNNPPLGRAELEVALGAQAKSSLTVEVGPPPEVPDANKPDEVEKGAEPAIKDSDR